MEGVGETRTAHDHDSPQKHWAPLIILFVCILFGAFWYYQRQQLPLQPAISPYQATTTPREEILSPDDLQAAVINTAIPDFSKDF